MTEQWSLAYMRFDELNTVWPVNERAIEQTLLKLEEPENNSCGLTNVDHSSWLLCRGDSDKHLVELVSNPLAHFGDTGVITSRIFFIARKKPSDRRALKVHWQSHPDVFVDVRADAVLQHSEALAIFTMFFKTNVIHHNFTTIPKPSNGYL